MNVLKKITPPLYLLQIFSAFFLLFYALGLPLLDTDTAWHLAAGEYIRTTFSIPHTNLWSFSAPNAVWYNVAWVWDVVISFLLDKTGARGLFLFLCIWYGLIGCAVALHLKERNFHPNAIYVALSVLVLMLILHQWARPQSFSLLLVAVFHYLLHRSRKDKTRAIILVLPALMVLWANTHGGFMAAFILFAAYAVEALLARNYHWLKTLLITAACCLLATCINPYGWKIWLSIYENTTSIFTPLIAEWAPYLFSSRLSVDLFLVALLLISNFGDRNVPLADKLLCLCWVLMACLSKRHFMIAAIVSMPMLAAGLKQWVPLKMKKKSLPTVRSPQALLMVGALIVILGCIPFHRWMKHDLLFADKANPSAALRFIREHYPHKKFMNEYDWGGYIIYFNKDVTPVFIDGRSRTAYPETIMAQAAQLLRADEAAYLGLIEHYHVDGLILYNDSPFLTRHPIPQNWKPAFKDNTISIYLIERN